MKKYNNKNGIQLHIFKYKEEDSFNDFTTIEIDSEIWFVASEICNHLDYKNTSSAVSRLDEDEIQTTIIDKVKKILISESGLYDLIINSNKPNAKKFRKWITKEVLPTIRKKGSYGINRIEMPNYIERYKDNYYKTDKGYFSVINELYIRFNSKLEQIGYIIPNRGIDGKEIRPDVSVGIMFAKYVKKNYPEFCNSFKTYEHSFKSGLKVQAKQYKNELLHIFIDFVENVWLPNNSPKYFKDRDPIALDFLPKLLVG